MTQYNAICRSNSVQVENEEAVAELLRKRRRRGTIRGTVDLTDGAITISGYDTFDVRTEAGIVITQEFLEELQTHLQGTLVLRQVGFTGTNDIPDAGQWVVTEDEVCYEELKHPYQIEDAPPETTTTNVD